MNKDISRHDKVTHFWCPQLGQPIHFGYCRQVREGLPCARVLACFGDHFDVQAFIQEHYTPEERARFLGPDKGRMERVVEALAQAGCKQEEKK